MGGGGGNTFTVTDTPSLGTTRLFTGLSGIVDTVNVRGTTGALSINSQEERSGVGGNAATVNVGDNGSVKRIRGTLNIENPYGYSTITVDASADATARTAPTLSSFVNPDDSERNRDPWGKIHGLAPADINYEYYDTELITIKPLPVVTGIVVNNGSAQRSMVTRLTVNFSVPVTIDPNAFELRQAGRHASRPDRSPGDGRQECRAHLHRVGHHWWLARRRPLYPDRPR